MHKQLRQIKYSRRVQLVTFSIFLLIVIIAGSDCNINEIDNIYKNGGEAIFARSCFEQKLRQGQSQQFAQYIMTFSKSHNKQLLQSLQEEISRLKKIHQQIILGESTVEPVIKWGQNISHIFINLKTSHRWDSPPCLNTKSQKSKLNDSILEYINVCHVSQQKIAFKFKINLYRQANSNGARGQNGQYADFSFRKNGVGVYSASFEKLQYDIWPFLNKQETNFALWTEITEMYPKDFQHYENITKMITKKRRQQKFSKQQTWFVLSFFLITLFFLF